jgi:hypothetical protein
MSYLDKTGDAADAMTSARVGEMDSLKGLAGREDEGMVEGIRVTINSAPVELFPCFEGAVDRTGLAWLVNAEG